MIGIIYPMNMEKNVILSNCKHCTLRPKTFQGQKREEMYQIIIEFVRNYWKQKCQQIFTKLKMSNTAEKFCFVALRIL